MATEYEAVIRLRPVDAGPERTDSLVALIEQHLPTEARIGTDRDGERRLLITVSLPVLAADTSEVQLQARDVVVTALDRAGLTEQAALLDDIDVRSSS